MQGDKRKFYEMVLDFKRLERRAGDRPGFQRHLNQKEMAIKIWANERGYEKANIAKKPKINKKPKAENITLYINEKEIGKFNSINTSYEIKKDEGEF